jgi:polyisoprenyl-phosphate glycosyltransferase
VHRPVRHRHARHYTRSRINAEVSQQHDGKAAERALTLLSVVTPMYDEEGSAEKFYSRVRDALGSLPWELVVVNDGSKDGTLEILHGLAAADPRVKVVNLARNFGHQAALSAGLEHAQGDAVAMIDADLQDPPELIPQMLASWRSGSDVVYAVRRQRKGETRFKLWTAHVFYRTLRRLTDIDLPADAGDFRLMDRRPLDALLAMRERSRFLRGMTVWVGYTQSAIEYDRDPRYAGETKYTLPRMVKFSLDAIVSFSSTPLQLATLFGFLCSAVAFLLVPLVIVGRFVDIFVAGIPTTLVVILLLGGVQLICVGIIGEYLGRIYDEVKRRPLYVVRDRVNFTGDAPFVGDERRGPARSAPPSVATKG